MRPDLAEHRMREQATHLREGLHAVELSKELEYEWDERAGAC
jgi:hypothetical protein